MKLICTIGSISCDKVLAEKGDIFEVGDKAGESLITSGYATEVGMEPEKPEPVESEEVVGSERFDGDITDESGEVSEDAVPDELWAIPDIKMWLTSHDSKYPNRAGKAELLSLVDQGE